MIVCKGVACLGCRNLNLDSSFVRSQLGAFSHLLSIDVSENSLVTHQFVAALVQTLPDLQSLKLNGCRSLAGTIVLSHLHELQTLELNRCPKVTRVVPSATLRHLEMRGGAMGEATLIDLLGSLPELRSLDLSEVASISDKVLATMALASPALAELHLKCCHVSEVALKFLASRCSKLKVLDLNACRGVTYTAIENIWDCLPYLQQLDLGSCLALRGELSVHCSRSLRMLNLSHCKAAHFLCVSGRNLETLLFRDNTYSRLVPRVGAVLNGCTPCSVSRKFGANMRCPNLKVLDLTGSAPVTDSR